MASTKQVTVTLDVADVGWITQQVESGYAPSTSAWIADTVRRRIVQLSENDALINDVLGAAPTADAVAWAARMIEQDANRTGGRKRRGRKAP